MLPDLKEYLGRELVVLQFGKSGKVHLSLLPLSIHHQLFHVIQIEENTRLTLQAVSEVQAYMYVSERRRRKKKKKQWTYLWAVSVKFSSWRYFRIKEIQSLRREDISTNSCLISKTSTKTKSVRGLKRNPI